MKLLIADDHPIFRKGLKDILNDSFKGLHIIERENGHDALECIRKEKPDIAILDINMPRLNGIEVLLELYKEHSGTRVVMLTMYKDKEVIKKAMNHGAFGYMIKDSAPKEITTCITKVSDGEKYIGPGLEAYYSDIAKENQGEGELVDLLKSLSQLELKVLKLIGQNKSTREIASLLFLSEKTVENYRSRICQKLLLPPRNNSLLLWTNEHKDLLYSISEF